MGNLFTTFTNCRLCINGKLVEGERLVVSQDSGEFLKSTGYIGGDIVDLDDAIIAPGFLDLNSCTPPEGIPAQQWIADKAAQYAQQGVTAFWITTKGLTSQQDELSNGLASLAISGPSCLGTHAASLTSQELESIVANTKAPSHLKLATLHVTQVDHIAALTDRGVKVAMTSRTTAAATEHTDQHHNNDAVPPSSSSTTTTTTTAVTYAQAETALYAGATALADPLDPITAPMTAADPGPVGLLALHDRVAPYVLIPCCDSSSSSSSSSSNNNNSNSQTTTMHAKSATLLFRATMASKRGILCTSSNSSSTTNESKPVVISGLDQCVRNMYYWANCDIAQAVAAVTENVAAFMGLTNRGRLAEGCRADFVVLDDGGNVRETWIAGRRVWPARTDGEDDDDDAW